MTRARLTDLRRRRVPACNIVKFGEDGSEFGFADAADEAGSRCKIIDLGEFSPNTTARDLAAFEAILERHCHQKRRLPEAGCTRYWLVDAEFAKLGGLVDILDRLDKDERLSNKEHREIAAGLMSVLDGRA